MLIKCREIDNRNALHGFMRYQMICKITAFLKYEHGAGKILDLELNMNTIKIMQ